MGLFHILHSHGQMEFALTQIILLWMIPQPCQLQREVRFAVSQIGQGKAAVSGFLPAHRLQPQRFMVKRQRTLQIRHIKIKMVERKHQTPPAIVFFIISRSVPARKRFCAAERVYIRQPEHAFSQFSRIPAPVFPTGIGRFVQNTVRFL